MPPSRNLNKDIEGQIVKIAHLKLKSKMGFEIYGMLKYRN